MEEPYAYYIDLSAKVEQMEHVILLNWVYVWLEHNLKSWEELHSFEYERDYGMVRADAFAVIKNRFTGRIRPSYVELDRGYNAFDKVRKYNDLYESEKYANEWWVEQVTGFPAVIIATTNGKRLRRINEAIERENRNGLEFFTFLVDQLRKDVIA